jgi:catechol 2,3-dioxygenase-like lactoylglutathione lyase family enzyme
MIEVNGVAHVILTVSDWERSRSFYEAFLAFLGLTHVFAGDDFAYYVGGRTALGINRADGKRATERFQQGTVGLHHVCFRCRNREDVDKVHAFLRTQPVTIVHRPRKDSGRPATTPSSLRIPPAFASNSITCPGREYWPKVRASNRPRITADHPRSHRRDGPLLSRGADGGDVGRLLASRQRCSARSRLALPSAV